MIPRAQFVAEARKWLGVPWVHQGRNRLGVDCAGLMLVTCWGLGLIDRDYDVRGYGIVPPDAMLIGECDRFCERVEQPQFGDVILMRLAKRLLHFGILTDGRVIHAWGARKVCEVTMPEMWRRRIAAAYTVRGVA